MPPRYDRRRANRAPVPPNTSPNMATPPASARRVEKTRRSPTAAQPALNSRVRAGGERSRYVSCGLTLVKTKSTRCSKFNIRKGVARRLSILTVPFQFRLTRRGPLSGEGTKRSPFRSSAGFTVISRNAAVCPTISQFPYRQSPIEPRFLFVFLFLFLFSFLFRTQYIADISSR